MATRLTCAHHNYLAETNYRVNYLKCARCPHYGGHSFDGTVDCSHPLAKYNQSNPKKRRY